MLYRVRHFSKHFVQRWGERVGGYPCLDQVNEAIASGQQIRRQADLWRRIDGALVPHRLLAEFWNHRLGLIIRIDEMTGTAITVIVPEQGDAHG